MTNILWTIKIQRVQSDYISEDKKAGAWSYPLTSTLLMKSKVFEATWPRVRLHSVVVGNKTVRMRKTGNRMTKNKTNLLSFSAYYCIVNDVNFPKRGNTNSLIYQLSLRFIQLRNKWILGQRAFPLLPLLLKTHGVGERLYSVRFSMNNATKSLNVKPTK